MGVYLELFDDHTLALKSSHKDRERVKGIGEGKWSKAVKRWLFPLSREVVDNARREYGKILIEPRIWTLLHQIASFQEKVQKIKKLKDCSVDESLVKVELYPHQRVGVKFSQYFEKMGVFDDMGLGKSLTSIYMAIWRKSRGEINKCIILAPKSTKQTVWERQITKFTNEKSLVANGIPKKRDQIYRQFKEDPQILFCVFGYETFRNDFTKLKEMGILNSGKNGVEMVIFDEVQKLKNRKAKISRVVKKLQLPYVIGLTGTPIHNRIEDLFGVLDPLAPGLLGSNFRLFSERYLKKGGRNRHVIGYRNLEELRKKVASISIRRNKEQVSNLPEKIYEDRILQMSDPAQRKAYQTMREQLYAQIRDMDDNEIRIRAHELFTRNIRLSQITSGFLSSPELKGPVWFHSSKVKEIDDILDDYVDSQIVIFTRWTACIDFLYQRYREKYKAVFLSGRVKDRDRTRVIDAFQSGEAKVCICQIQTASLGIDLSAAKIGIFMGKALLSPGTLAQSESRIHRTGLKEACELISLIVQNSIDERWDLLMRQKQALADQIIPVFNKQDWLYLAGK